MGLPPRYPPVTSRLNSSLQPFTYDGDIRVSLLQLRQSLSSTRRLQFAYRRVTTVVRYSVTVNRFNFGMFQVGLTWSGLIRSDPV